MENRRIKVVGVVLHDAELRRLKTVRLSGRDQRLWDKEYGRVVKVDQYLQRDEKFAIAIVFVICMLIAYFMG